MRLGNNTQGHLISSPKEENDLDLLNDSPSQAVGADTDKAFHSSCVLRGILSTIPCEPHKVSVRTPANEERLEEVLLPPQRELELGGQDGRGASKEGLMSKSAEPRTPLFPEGIRLHLHSKPLDRMDFKCYIYKMSNSQ